MRFLVTIFFNAIAALVLCASSPFSHTALAQSNGNGKIAFTSDRVIYTINQDGSNRTQLTNLTSDGTLNRFPVWSPDGQKIAFSRSTLLSSAAEIYVMNSDGTNAVRLTNNTANDTQPSWSPDGTKISFVSNRDGNDEIYVMNADGSNATRLTSNSAYDMDPAWSPDGSKIAFTSSRDFPGITGNIAAGFEIYVMNSDGTNAVRLTNNNAVDADPSWSPTGASIAFTTQRDNIPLVYVMNSNGSNQTNITFSTTLDSSDAAWSPDGSKIAFTSYNRENNRSNADEIYLMNPDGSSITRLTTSSLDEHDLSWQPVQSGSTTPLPTNPPTTTPPIVGTISGRVTDNLGNGMANVTLTLVGNLTGTQVVHTDASGHYSIGYYSNYSIMITPYKSGYLFDPAGQGPVSSSIVTGDYTFSFKGTPFPIVVFNIPVLLTEENSLRALALDSVTLMRDPFPVIAANNLSSDKRTRITLFAVGVELNQGESLTEITAQAKDSLNKVYSLPVESVRKVPGYSWLSQVVLKLPDEIGNAVEVWVTVSVHGFASNKVLIKVKPS